MHSHTGARARAHTHTHTHTHTHVTEALTQLTDVAVVTGAVLGVGVAPRSQSVARVTAVVLIQTVVVVTAPQVEREVSGGTGTQTERHREATRN